MPTCCARITVRARSAHVLTHLSHMAVTDTQVTHKRLTERAHLLSLMQVQRCYLHADLAGGVCTLCADIHILALSAISLS